MKVVIAPDKFKGSLRATEVAHAIAEGVRRAVPDAQIELCPIADGGEGTVAALVEATGGELITHRVTGPLPEMKVDATFGMLGPSSCSRTSTSSVESRACSPSSAIEGERRAISPATRGEEDPTAVIEMAAASGLHLLRREQYDPMATTTFGTGELMVEAVRRGAKRILLGIGGSATTDGGIGALQACGFPVLLEDGEPTSMTEPLCGQDLARVVLIKHGRGGPIDGIPIDVACDVTNPLFGPNGAARIFGPQKGATPQQVNELDQMLQQLATRTGKLMEAQTPGAGAAGGLGFGLIAFAGAKLRPGVEIVIEATKLRERLRGADLCITGEGCYDATTLQGKAPIGVARVCEQLNVKCCLLAGRIDDIHRSVKDGPDPFLGYFALSPPATPEKAMTHAVELLSKEAEKILKIFRQR
jgi:glycerate kinase